MLVSCITISRYIEEDGQDLVYVEAVDSSGDVLPIVESLGLLELAKDTVIREAMGETEEAE